MSQPAPSAKSGIETSTIRTISWRLIPFLVNRRHGLRRSCRRTFAVFWTLPTAWLSGTAAAGGIALINSIGNLAGFGGPYLIGWVKDATGSTSNGLLVLSLLPFVAGLLVFLVGHETKTEFVGAK